MFTRLVAALVVALGLTGGVAQAAPLTVTTYNIHHAEGVDGRLDVPRIARELDATGADVIGLQEVDRHWGARSEFADQATRLARRLDMNVVYGANLDLDPLQPGQPRRQYGTAILSRHPIVSSRNTLLPRPENGEQRGLLEAVIAVKGARVRVANTHLQHNSANERTAQVLKIMELLDGSKQPTVLIGDLNATPEAAELAPLFTRFDDAWTLGGTGDGFTIPVEAPDRRIDYVLVSPEIEVKRAEVRSTPASDHLPVTAKLKVNKKVPELAQATFNAARETEARLAFTASAPRTDWALNGREAAVVSVLVDGEETQDVVLFSGADPFTYRVSLGRVSAGRHTVSIVLDRKLSPPAVGPVRISSVKPALTAVGDLVARHAPILYGRDLPEIPGRWENARTDVPLLAYHASQPAADGTRTIEYSVIWSNEDGGTNTPALMARWGRTTDIEWIYRVRVDATGRALDAVYHGANHVTTPFTGAKEGDHPLLQTVTSNNNLRQVDDVRLASGYRFFLDPSGTLPAGRTREAVMDASPWSYQVMAKEMLREGRLEATPDPATPEVSDLRNYLYLELDKTTSAGAGVGTALAVKLRGSDRWYASHHEQPTWSIERDGPAATTVELPAGTSPADVEAVKAFAVPVAAAPPADWRIEVRSIARGFMLGADYAPGASFVSRQGSAVLTAASPEAVLWQAP